MSDGTSMVKSRRLEHAEDTKEALIGAARALFGERGYAETGIDDVARHARVTRGALYHHFTSKQDLFRAVVQRLYADLLERLAEVGSAAEARADTEPAPDLWDMVRAGYRARLDVVCADPAFQRIVDRDASSVLGHDALIEIAQGSADTLLVPVLEEAIRAGLIRPLPVGTLANLMGAMIGAAGREIATAEDQQAARGRVGEAVDALLQGLRRT